MTDYIPTEKDLEPYYAELAVLKDYDEVAEQLGVTANKIQTLLKNSPEAIDIIKAAEAEFIALLKLRALLLMPQALDTMESAMMGVLDGKKAMAAVRAAGEIMDRTAMPKITRASGDIVKEATNRALPDLADLIKDADPEDASAIIDKYMATMDDLNALRKGKVIDGNGKV